MNNKNDIKQRWDAFWQGDMIERPIVCIGVPGVGKNANPLYDDNYFTRINSDLDEHIQGVLKNSLKNIYMGEAEPSAFLSFGCDEIAAFCGGELIFNKNTMETNWSKPFVDDWEESLPFNINDDDPLWRRMLLYIEKSAKAYKGKVDINPIDLHTNMDLLLAVRGGQELCIDLIECPETIDRAMMSAREIFKKVWYDTRAAGNMHKKSGATLQCDFSCMISTEMFRRWALPALEE